MSNNIHGLSDGNCSVAKSSKSNENSMALKQPLLSSTSVMPSAPSLYSEELSTPSPLLLPSTDVTQPPQPLMPRMISSLSPPPPPPPLSPKRTTTPSLTSSWHTLHETTPEPVPPPMEHYQTLPMKKQTNLNKNGSLSKTKMRILYWTKVDNQQLSKDHT